MEVARSVRRGGFPVHWEANPLLSSVFVLWRSLASREQEGTSGSDAVVKGGKSAGPKKRQGVRKNGR